MGRMKLVKGVQERQEGRMQFVRAFSRSIGLRRSLCVEAMSVLKQLISHLRRGGVPTSGSEAAFKSSTGSCAPGPRVGVCTGARVC